MAAPALLVLDLGNTAIKFVEFGEDGEAIHASRLAPGWDTLLDLFARIERNEGVPIVAVSVNEEWLSLFRRGLKGRTLRVAGRNLRMPIANRTRKPAETGGDRLCAALGAHGRAGGAAAAVGLGTAITADAVDASGAFLGGAIAPGLAAAAAGLSRAAAGLPKTGPGRKGPAPYPGRSTAEALRAGLLLGFAGLVDRLAREASRAAADGEGAAPVYLHGGDAEAVLPFLESPVVHAPFLVAEGARLAWLRTRRG